MTERKETAAERLARMKREKEAASDGNTSEIVGQLTHETDGEPDFLELAQKLRDHLDGDPSNVQPNVIKYTLYIDEPVAEAFKALCVKRGDQRVYGTEALSDFVKKKAREMGL